MLYFRCWTRTMFIFLLAWFGALMYLVHQSWKSSENEGLLDRQLTKVHGKLVRLREENRKLHDLLKAAQKQLEGNRMHQSVGGKNDISTFGNADTKYFKLKIDKKTYVNDPAVKKLDSPTQECELAIRKLFIDVIESWRYVRGKLETNINSSDTELTILLKRTLMETQQIHASLLVNVNKLSEFDGYKYWRKWEAKELSNLVQKRLHTLQNPKDCSTARKLVCNLDKDCGYGCQIHHAVYCFIAAYATERTLILESKGWSYNEGGFEDVFKPLSETCDSIVGGSITPWSRNDDSLVVGLPAIDSINPRPKFLPPAIPEDLSYRLIRLHDNPSMWWVAQFLKYMLRPQDNTAELLKTAESGRNANQPMVGIHIRRTDKVESEAGFHEVDEYMQYVEEYFQQLETNRGYKLEIKQVYVASDDPNVLPECQNKFPEYEFLGDQSTAKSAAVSSRYNLESLRGVIIDVHMLSLSDFIVCTFSSQICKLAYEIQQQRYVDGSWRFKSLDDIWYFGGQEQHQQEVVMQHLAKDEVEINLNIGDTIGVAGNHWNGYSKGTNHANNEIGLYPQYKTKDKIKIVAFPTYPHVKL